MTYEIYRYIFIGAAALAGIMLLLSIFLFIKFKIPKVLGDVTGSTAKKAIKNIREGNIQSGDKAYKSSVVNMERGKLTDKISASGQLVKNQTSDGTTMLTTKLDTQELIGSSETTVLSAELNPANEPTSGATTILSETELTDSNTIIVEYDITFVHTNEIIS